MKDLQPILGFGFTVLGLVAATNVFSSRLNSVQKQGLSLVSGVLLVAAAYTLVTRIEDTVDDARRLL